MISHLTGLSANQAWWALRMVMPDGNVAIQAVQHAERGGADFGSRYHVHYSVNTDTYEVMLDLRPDSCGA